MYKGSFWIHLKIKNYSNIVKNSFKFYTLKLKLRFNVIYKIQL